MKEKTKEIKPFIKWVDGKTQLLKQFAPQLPSILHEWKEFTYLEAFREEGANTI